MGPLSGLKVVDLTHVMAGPTCTLMLADMGAEVIKIEKIPAGDDTRYMVPPKIGDVAASFLMMNRNKKGIALDLKTPGGAKVLRRLIGSADVLVENFGPGVMDRLGFGYAEISKDHPALIYCSLSGFGRTGPYKHRRGFDLVAQASQEQKQNRPKKMEDSMSQKRKFAAIAFGLALGMSGAANAAWQPAKPIEFVATAGPGGGTDNFARAVQNIITKYKFVEQPIVVTNKAGGSGAEGYTYTKAMAGDPYKIVFGTSNAWTQPIVSKVPYNYTDLTPIAAMVQDEFLLWVKQDAPYQNVQDYLKAVAAKPAGDFKMGGAQSKDTDETLTRMIDKAAKVKFTYIPFKSGAEAAVQLAGGHIDSHVNNPSESIGQWKGSTQRPLCAFSPQRLPDGPKVTQTKNWHDIPTCVESGLDIPQFQQPRTVWLPGKVTADQAAFYVGVMKKVQGTPEWKEYIERTSQTDTFLSGEAFSKFIKEDIDRTHKIAADEGWLVSN